jgi:hypothetical protein
MARFYPLADTLHKESLLFRKNLVEILLEVAYQWCYDVAGKNAAK